MCREWRKRVSCVATFLFVILEKELAAVRLGKRPVLFAKLLAVDLPKLN